MFLISDQIDFSSHGAYKSHGASNEPFLDNVWK